MNVILAIN